VALKKFSHMILSTNIAHDTLHLDLIQHIAIFAFSICPAVKMSENVPYVVLCGTVDVVFLQTFRDKFVHDIYFTKVLAINAFCLTKCVSHMLYLPSPYDTTYD
jgi:hypothetical protein